MVFEMVMERLGKWLWKCPSLISDDPSREEHGWYDVKVLFRFLLFRTQAHLHPVIYSSKDDAAKYLTQ
jgi:hypothetical protein